MQHCQQGRYEEGWRLWERALEVDPRHVHSLRNLGILHSDQGRPDEAQSLFERALEVDPRHIETLCDLGTLHCKQGRFDEARPAPVVDPQHVPTLCSLGSLHYQHGRDDEARSLRERALVVDPESGAVQRLLHTLTSGIAAWPTLAAPPAVEIGAVVRVAGLATRPELNGSCGMVRSFDAEAGR